MFFKLKDWCPLLNVEHVILGLFHLFYEPNAADVQNVDAGRDLRNDRNRFQEMEM